MALLRKGLAGNQRMSWGPDTTPQTLCSQPCLWPADRTSPFPFTSCHHATHIPRYSCRKAQMRLCICAALSAISSSGHEDLRPLGLPSPCSCECICRENLAGFLWPTQLWRVDVSLRSVCSARKWKRVPKPDCCSSADLASHPPSMLPKHLEQMSSKGAPKGTLQTCVMSDKALHRRGACGVE